MVVLLGLVDVVGDVDAGCAGAEDEREPRLPVLPPLLPPPARAQTGSVQARTHIARSTPTITVDARRFMAAPPP